jgi:hypothetical protein
MGAYLETIADATGDFVLSKNRCEYHSELEYL